MVSLPQVYLTKLCMHNSSYTYVLHAPPITYFLILLNSDKFVQQYPNMGYKVMLLGRYIGWQHLGGICYFLFQDRIFWP